MDNEVIARIKYTKGQMLTARDFQDQQEYHRLKQKQLLQRFPPGIIAGLKVTCAKKGVAQNDFDGFLIEKGLAVDRDGNEIIVPNEGFKVPVTDFKDAEAGYLSLVYSEDEELIGDSLCGTNQKNNRIRESFKVEWNRAPNLGSSITVAQVQLKDGKVLAPTCDNFDVITDDKVGGPRIRLDARVVGTEQITKGAITSEKIRIDAVIEEKIADSAVTERKLSTEVRGKLVDEGNSHNHTGGHGAAIPEGGLDNAIKAKLVTTGDQHDHTGGHGAAIPEGGLHPTVATRLVTGGDSHNHRGGDGLPIPEGGLEDAVKFKLVKNGNLHDHSGGDGARIPEAGLDASVQAKLITGGNGHDHTGGHGAVIPEGGLHPTVAARLVTGGDSHNHTGGDGGPIPEGGLDANVQAKLVTRGNGHDHSSGDGDLIRGAGLAPSAVTSDKLNLISELDRGTFGTPEKEIDITNVPTNVIIQVIPTLGSLSWTFSVAFAAANFLNYKIKLTNVSGGTVGFVVRAIAFN
jgi:hypothetical protein